MFDIAKDETALATLKERITITDDLIEKQFDRIVQLTAARKDTKQASEDLRMLIRSLYLLEEQRLVTTARIREATQPYGVIPGTRKSLP